VATIGHAADRRDLFTDSTNPVNTVDLFVSQSPAKPLWDLIGMG
jgi:hypothetical protein